MRVVELPVYKGPGFAYDNESFKRVHHIPRIMLKWQIKLNRRFVEYRQFPLRPAYSMMYNKPQGKAMGKGRSGPDVGAVCAWRAACSYGPRVKSSLTDGS